jgi:1-acyl-sn-glycerol-3-phosphate acyltransferase
MTAVWGLGLLILGPPCILLTRLTGWEGFVTYAATGVLKVGMFVAGIRLTVVGKERLDPDGVYVYTPNHQSFLDACVVWTSLGTPANRPGYLFKRELLRVPILGYGVRQIGMLPVNRADHHRAVATAKIATEQLHAGRSFAVFPEGTRTKDGRLGAFKKGAFRMAVDARVPIVPVSIEGAYQAMPWGTLRVRAVPIVLTVHEPIPTAGLGPDDVDELLDKTRSVIAEAIGDPGSADAAGSADVALCAAGAPPVPGS